MIHLQLRTKSDNLYQDLIQIILLTGNVLFILMLKKLKTGYTLLYKNSILNLVKSTSKFLQVIFAIKSMGSSIFMISKPVSSSFKCMVNNPVSTLPTNRSSKKMQNLVQINKTITQNVLNFHPMQP